MKVYSVTLRTLIREIMGTLKEHSANLKKSFCFIKKTFLTENNKKKTLNVCVPGTKSCYSWVEIAGNLLSISTSRALRRKQKSDVALHT